jgi:hypothetical protein
MVGSNSSSIYIYNDILSYIIHDIFDNLFCSNIHDRLVLNKFVHLYLAILS